MCDFEFGRLTLLLVGCVLACGTPLVCLSAEVNSPLSPAASLEHFQVEPGLAVELVACEPEIIDPVAMRFDEDGRLWVVEMRDYPNGPAESEQTLSQIRVLSDRDGDGRFETSKVFADHLLFPTGVQPWRGGVIVTLAGEVIYLRDDDGDSRADHREVWYQGFVAENPQLRANHPRFAFDNRVYIANGLRGGTVIDPRQPDDKRTPVSISGMDFRFDPRSGRCEAVSGNGQFGLTFDDAGNRFTCNNRVPLFQVVLDNKYLARNPFLAAGTVVHEVAPSGERSHVFPRTSAWTTSNLHAGQFTAACGVEIYRSDTLGQAYHGNAFVCEPTGSLVHRELLRGKSVTVDSQPSDAQREFLSSDDPWFRPVNLESGPDGALYVVDMYRAVIEHPQFMPSELQKRSDMRLGDDRGRIYRVVRERNERRPAAARLSQATTAELVKLLAHENSWWRETAARLLYERQDRSPAAITALAEMASNGNSPTARVAALWALEGCESLSDAHLLHAMDDRDPLVREHSVMLAEPRLPNSDPLKQRTIRLAADKDSRVLFRVALAMGGLEGAEVIGPLVRIGLERADDSWTRLAVATCRSEQAAPLVSALLANSQVASKPLGAPELELLRELATVVGSRRAPDEIIRILGLAIADTALPPSGKIAALAAARGIERRGDCLSSIVAANAPLGPLADQLATYFERILGQAADEQTPEETRLIDVELLRFATSDKARGLLVQLLSDCPAQEIRLRAANAVAGQLDGELPARLLASYASQAPAVRRAILDALVANAIGAQAVLDAVKSGQIARPEIDAARETRLLKHADREVRAAAAKLLSREPPAERKAVLADYRTALTLKADPAQGKELFRKHCSACHHIGDLGVDVAPDISDSRVKTAEQLLVDILNPNQAIDNNYVSYNVVTNDGTVHSGIIAGETAASITLKAAEGKTIGLLRADIESITSSGQSLMPEGLERSLPKQEMADLISFIKNWRYLAERIPGVSASP